MKPIGVTMGDPSGIGPEIVVAALRAAPALRGRVVIFGDRGVLLRAGLDFTVAVADVTALTAEEAPPGRPTIAGAHAQVAYLEKAVGTHLAALVTAPISKTQIAAAGLGFPGHTEYLAARYGAAEHAMAFFGPRLRVVLATIHVALAEVSRALTAEAVARAIYLGVRALPSARRVGVLGLNPHAGEGGMFGREELEVITPGIEAGRARLGADGIPAEVVGPLVPDAAYRQPFDLFVAMYHDQALIPVKLIDFEQAVNVTLGLPIVRTSPDHGVAYDIAGKGVARHTSFLAALELAAQLASPATG